MGFNFLFIYLPPSGSLDVWLRAAGGGGQHSLTELLRRLQRAGNRLQRGAVTRWTCWSSEDTCERAEALPVPPRLADKVSALRRMRFYAPERFMHCYTVG